MVTSLKSTVLHLGFVAILFSGAATISAAAADNKPAIAIATTPSYDCVYVDHIVNALYAVGVPNEAPADSSYELLNPSVVMVQRAASHDPQQATVLAVYRNGSWHQSPPLHPMVADYVWDFLFTKAGCTQGYPRAALSCLRTVDLDRSYCTASYTCVNP